MAVSNNQEAFTYCWTDHKTNKLYVGYHKGQQDDGYVCSQPLFLEQYNKRPADFTRIILAEGTTEDCHALEISILRAADAKHSKQFYNKSDGSSPYFACKGHTEETKKKMRAKILSEETRKKISKALSGKETSLKTKAKLSLVMTGHVVSEETRQKISNANKNKPSPNKGKSFSKETREKISKALTGRIGSNAGKHLSQKTRNKISLAMMGKRQSEETKQKRRNKFVSEETRRKLSIAASKDWIRRKG